MKKEMKVELISALADKMEREGASYEANIIQNIAGIIADGSQVYFYEEVLRPFVQQRMKVLAMVALGETNCWNPNDWQP